MTLINVAAALIALQLGAPSSGEIETVQYRAYAHPPPCGHGFDLSNRDGLCYPNGFLAPRDQEARTRFYGGYNYYPRPRRHYRYHYND